MDKETTLEQQVIHIFETWNAWKIRKHRFMNARMKRYINEALAKNSMQEICNAIINYSKVLHDQRAWYKFKYNLDDFLAKKYEWFLDENEPMKRFCNINQRSGETCEWKGESTPPDSLSISPDYKERFIQWKKEKKE